jgi:hypothetical protein
MPGNGGSVVMPRTKALTILASWAAVSFFAALFLLLSGHAWLNNRHEIVSLFSRASRVNHESSVSALSAATELFAVLENVVATGEKERQFFQREEDLENEMAINVEARLADKVVAFAVALENTSALSATQPDVRDRVLRLAAQLHGSQAQFLNHEVETFRTNMDNGAKWFAEYHRRRGSNAKQQLQRLQIFLLQSAKESTGYTERTDADDRVDSVLRSIFVKAEAYGKEVGAWEVPRTVLQQLQILSSDFVGESIHPLEAAAKLKELTVDSASQHAKFGLPDYSPTESLEKYIADILRGHHFMQGGIGKLRKVNLDWKNAEVALSRFDPFLI